MRNLSKRSDEDLIRLAGQIRQEKLLRAGSWQECQQCQAAFLARARARFCSGRCRTAAYRRRMSQAAA